jgi:hypothetical protein
MLHAHLSNGKSITKSKLYDVDYSQKDTFKKQ